MSTTIDGQRVDTLANPELYRRLAAYFGRDAVTVLKPGQVSRWRRTFPINGVEGQKVKFKDAFARDQKGEEYRLNCPFCGDTGNRLFINHQWALWDGTTQSKKRFLAYCHNSDCMADPVNQDQLYSYLFERKMMFHADPASDVAQVRATPEKFTGWTPGSIRTIDDVGPSNPAVRFLVDREYDPRQIERDWEIGICMSSRSVHYAGRIYIPIHQNGELAGWMCRYPGDRVGGKTLKEAGVKKYLFAPGMHTSELLYNFDQAKERRALVIVEGATSAWRVGTNAVAVFGKKLHDPQCRMISSLATGGALDCVILMLDPSQSAEDIRRNSPHHITVAERTLRPYMGRCPLVVVRLPEGSDPGSLNRRLVYQITLETAAKGRFSQAVLDAIQKEAER